MQCNVMQSNSIVRRKKVEQKMWRVSPSCLNVSHEVKKEASSTQVKKERKKKYIPFPFFPPDLISHRPPTSKPKTKDPKDQGKAGEKKRETSPVERDQNHQPLSQPSPTQRRTKNQRTGQRGVDISPLKPNQKPCFSAAAAAAAAAHGLLAVCAQQLHAFVLVRCSHAPPPPPTRTTRTTSTTCEHLRAFLRQTRHFRSPPERGPHQGALRSAEPARARLWSVVWSAPSLKLRPVVKWGLTVCE